jgi:site-specific DNA-methyltransferase (adenine-specific)
MSTSEVDATCNHCGHGFRAAPKARHRVLCGDTRKAEDVARLFGDERAQVVITSPPYADRRAYDAGSGFRPVPPEEYVDWWEPVQANVAARRKPSGSFFLNIKEHCEDGQRVLYVKDLTLAHVRRWGWLFVDELCWRDLKNGVPGGWPNRFKDAWEPVFHFARTTAIKFRPDAVSVASDACFDYSADSGVTGTGSGLKGVPAGGYRSGMARPSNVVEVAAAATQDHSAAYPVGLPEFFIKAFSDEGDAVFDPFLGSGTTLIAAERNRRRAFGTEISPVYCDVIVTRWERFTGRKAVRLAR